MGIKVSPQSTQTCGVSFPFVFVQDREKTVAPGLNNLYPFAWNSRDFSWLALGRGCVLESCQT